LFKAGVRPLWEDPVNKGGGRFVLHIKRIFANKTWEDIIIAFIITNKDNEHLNGVVINVRSWEVLLSIWMKPLTTEEMKEKYRTWIRQSLGMSENIKIEYKEHPNPEDVKNKPPHNPEDKDGKPFVSTPQQAAFKDVDSREQQFPVSTPKQQAYSSPKPAPMTPKDQQYVMPPAEENALEDE